MPAGRSQPAEQRVLALLLIEVKTLRIELRGKRLDGLRRERIGADLAVGGLDDPRDAVQVAGEQLK